MKGETKEFRPRKTKKKKKKERKKEKEKEKKKEKNKNKKEAQTDNSIKNPIEDPPTRDGHTQQILQSLVHSVKLWMFLLVKRENKLLGVNDVNHTRSNSRAPD